MTAAVAALHECQKQWVPRAKRYNAYTTKVLGDIHKNLDKVRFAVDMSEAVQASMEDAITVNPEQISTALHSLIVAHEETLKELYKGQDLNTTEKLRQIVDFTVDVCSRPSKEEVLKDKIKKMALKHHEELQIVKAEASLRIEQLMGLPSELREANKRLQATTSTMQEEMALLQRTNSYLKRMVSCENGIKLAPKLVKFLEEYETLLKPRLDEEAPDAIGEMARTIQCEWQKTCKERALPTARSLGVAPLLEDKAEITTEESLWVEQLYQMTQPATQVIQLYLLKYLSRVDSIRIPQNFSRNPIIRGCYQKILIRQTEATLDIVLKLIFIEKARILKEKNKGSSPFRIDLEKPLDPYLRSQEEIGPKIKSKRMGGKPRGFRAKMKEFRQIKTKKIQRHVFFVFVAKIESMVKMNDLKGLEEQVQEMKKKHKAQITKRLQHWKINDTVEELDLNNHFRGYVPHNSMIGRILGTAEPTVTNKMQSEDLPDSAKLDSNFFSWRTLTFWHLERALERIYALPDKFTKLATAILKYQGVTKHPSYQLALQWVCCYAPSTRKNVISTCGIFAKFLYTDNRYGEQILKSPTYETLLIGISQNKVKWSMVQDWIIDRAAGELAFETAIQQTNFMFRVFEIFSKQVEGKRRLKIGIYKALKNLFSKEVVSAQPLSREHTDTFFKWHRQTQVNSYETLTLHRLFQIMFLFLLRFSEAANMRKSDVWFRKKGQKTTVRLRILRTKTGQRGKQPQWVELAEMKYPMNPVEIVHEVAKGKDLEEFLFKIKGKKVPHKKANNYIMEVMEKFTEYMSDTDLPVELEPGKKWATHMWRATGICHLFAMGIHVQIIAEHSRHKSDTLLTYIRKARRDHLIKLSETWEAYGERLEKHPLAEKIALAIEHRLTELGIVKPKGQLTSLEMLRPIQADF